MGEMKQRDGGALQVDRMQWRVVHCKTGLPLRHQKQAQQEVKKRFTKLLESLA